MNPVLAASFTISGIHGVLLIFAVILFLIAGIVAWFVGRTYWATCVAVGLCLVALSMLVT